MELNYLTIRQAAEMLGVTPLTLRNWDKKGILTAYRHPANNYRLYRYADIEDLLLELQQSNPARQENAPVHRLEVRFEEDEPEATPPAV